MGRRALLDEDAGVRAAGIALLAELREVLVADPGFVTELHRAAAHPEPEVRVAALGALWRHHHVDAAVSARHLADPDPSVRVEAVQALVSLDDRPAVRDRRRPRPRRPRGRGPGPGHAGRTDHRGHAAPAGRGRRTGGRHRRPHRARPHRLPAGGDDGGGARLRDPYWQVREAAAVALAAADPAVAIGPLTEAAGDDNIDVRRAAVRGLSAWARERPEVTEVLRAAADDPDADVRAHEGLHDNPTREAATWPR